MSIPDNVPLLKADKKYSELSDLLKQVNVFDFAKAAKAKLYPVAWDGMGEAARRFCDRLRHRGRGA